MVTFFIILLAVSIAGMLSLLLLKRYELSTGRIFLSGIRPGLGEFFHQKLLWLEYVLPGLIRVGLASVYKAVRRLVYAGAGWVVLKLEQGLEHALHRVRTTGVAPRASGEASPFLQEVAEHKKKLQDEVPERSTVIEE